MRDAGGARRLQRALREQDSRSLEKWLKDGADPSLVLPEGIAAIHLAVGQDTEGAIRCLKLLLQYGADPNVSSSEDLTPLHVAASWGCIKCVKLLLRNGADPSLLDQDGQRAIDLAREQGNVKCCQILQQYQDYSLLEETEEDVPAFRYVGFRRVSSVLCSFTNLVEPGCADSCKTSILPGKPEEFEAASRTRKTLSEGQWEFVPSAGALNHSLMNGSGDPLGEVTSVWSQACAQSTSTKPPSLCGTSGIPEDRGEGEVGEDAEHASRVLLSTCLSSFGKFEEQALKGLVSEADPLKDHSPSDQDFSLQDAQGFVPEAVRPLLDTSDDDSFLPPSAPGTPLPGTHRSATSTSPHPVTAECSFAPQTLAISLEEKEVFTSGGPTGDTEWLSELDYTCPLTRKSQPYVSPSEELNVDSELLVRLPKGKGIDVTSPDHVYEFTHSNMTFLTDLDKTTAVIEGGLDHTQVSDYDSSLHIECVQSESNVSTSGDSPYCSCVSNSEVFASSVGNFSNVCRPKPDREDPVIPTDEGCLSTPSVLSASYRGSSPSSCQTGIVLWRSESVPRCSVSQRCPDSRQTPLFNGVQLFDENPAATPLSGGTVRSMYCPASQTTGQRNSSLAHPGAGECVRGGFTHTSGCWGQKEMRMEKEQVVPDDGSRSHPLTTPAESTEEQSKPESRPAREPIRTGSQVEVEGVLDTSMNCSLSDQAEQQGPGGLLSQGEESNTRANLDQEGGAAFQMRSMNNRPSEGGLPSFEQSLSPFVTVRTRKGLASPAPQICDSSLFDQSIPILTRTRRVRRQRENPGPRSSWLCPSGSVSRDGEDQDHFPAEEDADFDTAPFVLCDSDKAASGRVRGSATAHTVPFSIEREAGVLPLSCDEHGNGLSLRRRGLASSGEEQQTPAFPPRESPTEPGRNQVDPRASGRAGTTLRLNDAMEDERCDPALKAITLCSPVGTVTVVDSSSTSGLTVFPGIPRHRSAVCSRPVPLGGGPDAQGWYCGVPACARLKDSNSQSEDQREISNHSPGPVASQLSQTECDHPVPLSPGGRPVSCEVGEAVEYLYTDAKGSPALIECCFPSRDITFQNTTTSSTEDTILYDWKAYRSTEEKENIPQSDERLPRHLQLLSNRQILRQLRECGEDPGPVTDLTRGVYLLRLHQVQKEPRPCAAGYSPELAQSLEKFVFPDCSQDEMALVQQFDQPDPKRRWREGVVKASFNYLLLDPRVTKNLPTRCHVLSPAECFQTFISSIFYVGKGKRSRSYSHLYEALKHFKGGKQQVNAKLKHIMDIWRSGHGVISLHCFQNVIPVEAYTREACMVDALGLQTLTNRKRGDYYGLVATWPLRRRRQLGVHLLERAMEIFLAEGERQLRPADV